MRANPQIPWIFSSGGGSQTFITEPYAYREYFDSQGYIPSRTTIYSDSETPTTSYEGRFTTSHSKSGSIYAKTITSAAGLTVDLPSPDSGIGTDAITPRDQNHIQQVNENIFILDFIFLFISHTSNTFRALHVIQSFQLISLTLLHSFS